MTLHKVLIVDIEEIRAVEIRCNNCPAFVSFPIGGELPRRLPCPSCNKEMLPTEAVHVRVATESLFQSLQSWQRAEMKPFQLTFTLDFPDA